MMGDDLRVVAANRQVCPIISEITFGNLYSRTIWDMRQLVPPAGCPALHQARRPPLNTAGSPGPKPAATCSPPALPHEQSSRRRNRIALPTVRGLRRDYQNQLPRMPFRFPLAL